jgi:large subunit ribosomal protein L4
VDSWGFDAPRTKDAIAALAAMGIEGRVLMVLRREDVNAALSFRNIPEVHLIENGQLNAYDVLVSDWVVFTADALPGAESPAATAAPAATDESVEDDQ